MPLISKPDEISDSPINQLLPFEQREDRFEQPPDFADLVKPALAMENSVVSAVSTMVLNQATPDEFDPNYDPFTPEAIEGYEEFIDEFTFFDNQSQEMAFKAKVDKEREWRDAVFHIV